MLLFSTLPLATFYGNTSAGGLLHGERLDSGSVYLYINVCVRVHERDPHVVRVCGYISLGWVVVLLCPHASG